MISNLSYAGKRMFEGLMNPFGSNTVGPKALHAVIPDGNGSVSTSACLTAQMTITPNTYAYGLIQLVIPCRQTGTTAVTGNNTDCYTNNVAIISVGKTADTEPDTMVASTCWNETAIFNASCANHYQMRVVAAGLRCYSISSSDNTQGMLEAGLSPKQVYYCSAANAATPTTSALSVAFTPFRIEEAHALSGARSGITIRRPYQNTDHEFATVPTRPFGALATTYDNDALFGMLPTIKWSNFSTTTCLRVEAVIHLEIQVSPQAYPGSLSTTPYEPKIGSIIQYSNSHELVKSGMSFKSYLGRSY